MTAWTHREAVELCKLVEGICPQYGCHVALTVVKVMTVDGRRIDCLFPELPGDYAIVACDERPAVAVRALERAVV